MRWFGSNWPPIRVGVTTAVVIGAMWAGALEAQTVVRTYTPGQGTPGGWVFHNASWYHLSRSAGQTFLSPSGGGTLEWFSFWLAGNPANHPTHPGTMAYRTYVVEWNGSAPTGPILWQSTTQAVPVTNAPQQVTFNTGGLHLPSDRLFLAFLTPAGLGEVRPNLLTYMDQWFLGGDPYTPGSAWYVDHAPGATVQDLINGSWGQGGTDLLFEAGFDTAVTPVPEPATVLLMATGLVGVGIAVRRRRARG